MAIWISTWSQTRQKV